MRNELTRLRWCRLPNTEERITKKASLATLLELCRAMMFTSGPNFAV
jgi:hypothetical protein